MVKKREREQGCERRSSSGDKFSSAQPRGAERGLVKSASGKRGASGGAPAIGLVPRRQKAERGGFVKRKPLGSVEGGSSVELTSQSPLNAQKGFYGQRGAIKPCAALWDIRSPQEPPCTVLCGLCRIDRDAWTRAC